MTNRTTAARLTRILGLVALTLALGASSGLAKEIASGGIVTPPAPAPVAAPCATISGVLAQSKKGTGESIGVNLDFTVSSCSSAAENLSYDLVLAGLRTGEVFGQTSVSVGSVGAGKKVVQTWAVGALPWNTGMTIDITVRDADTGDVLATQRVFTGTPVHKV